MTAQLKHNSVSCVWTEFGIGVNKRNPQFELVILLHVQIFRDSLSWILFISRKPAHLLEEFLGRNVFPQQFYYDISSMEYRISGFKKGPKRKYRPGRSQKMMKRPWPHMLEFFNWYLDHMLIE